MVTEQAWMDKSCKSVLVVRFLRPDYQPSQVGRPPSAIKSPLSSTYIQKIINENFLDLNLETQL